MFGLDLLALLVIAFLAVIAVVVVVLVVYLVVRASRNREAAQPAGMYTSGPPPAAAQSVEARLHELDSLRARGVISYDEYVAARQRAIDGQSPT